jgi:DNA gyrase subunit A
MGRNSSGVKGIRLTAGDSVIGMLVADPEATLLTACANGYGKRTPFGPNSPAEEVESATEGVEAADDDREDEMPEVEAEVSDESEEGDEGSSGQRYRTQHRGGKGLRDIKTTERNGPAIGISSVRDDDEIFMITSRGKLQRIAVADISIIGRNTQGVKIMGLDEGDTLVALKRVPKEEAAEKENGAENDEG